MLLAGTYASLLVRKVRYIKEWTKDYLPMNEELKDASMDEKLTFPSVFDRLPML